jgi:hypothetical protein
MNPTEQITPKQLEQMQAIYAEHTLFPTMIHFLIFILIIMVSFIGIYIIARAIHYKLECKRLKRQIKQLEDKLNA